MIQYVLPIIVPTLKALVHQLVVADYASLEVQGHIAPSWAGGLSTSADEIARVIEDYGATLIDIPDEAFMTAQTIGSSGISFDLWTAEEGRSGLALDVRVVHEVSADAPRVQIERLHGFPPKIIPALQEVVHHLVIADYAGLEANGHLSLSGLSGADVEAAVTEYRDRAFMWAVEAGARLPTSPAECVLIDMPTSAFKQAEAYGGGPNEWHVDVPLWWSDDCAGCDLTLQAEVSVTPAGIDVQVMDLHVL